MSISDYKVREVSVPFLARPFGSIYGLAGVKTDINVIDDFQTSNTQVKIRIATPYNMRIKECYFTLIIKVATTQSLGVKVGIGQFATGSYEADTFDTAKVEADHLKLTGSSSYISATAGNYITIDSLDIFRLLPKDGDSNFREDGFVICLLFNATPDTNNSYHLERFQVNCSAMLGVL